MIFYCDVSVGALIYESVKWVLVTGFTKGLSMDSMGMCLVHYNPENITGVVLGSQEDVTKTQFVSMGTIELYHVHSHTMQQELLQMPMWQRAHIREILYVFRDNSN